MASGYHTGCLDIESFHRCRTFCWAALLYTIRLQILAVWLISRVNTRASRDPSGFGVLVCRMAVIIGVAGLNEITHAKRPTLCLVSWLKIRPRSLWYPPPQDKQLPGVPGGSVG